MRGEPPEALKCKGEARPVQTVWIALRANLRAVLEVTLADVVAGELPEAVRS